MKAVFPFCLAVMLFAVGCDDTVTRRYATRQMAEKKQLFAQGWLPEIIPGSSFDIVTRNDLDLNTSEGEFSFAAQEGAAFKAQLRRMESREVPASEQLRYLQRGYWPYEWMPGERWIFYIHESRGHCEYQYEMNARVSGS